MADVNAGYEYACKGTLKMGSYLIQRNRRLNGEKVQGQMYCVSLMFKMEPGYLKEKNNFEAILFSRVRILSSVTIGKSATLSATKQTESYMYV